MKEIPYTASHAQNLRRLALELQDEIITVMSNPIEYLEKGYWSFPLSTTFVTNSETMLSFSWVQQWLLSYGWVWKNNRIFPAGAEPAADSEIESN